MLLLKYDFINFSLENERSVVATVTGMVRYNINAVQTSLKISAIEPWLTMSILVRCFTVGSFAISDLKQALNAISWLGNFMDKSWL